MISEAVTRAIRVQVRSFFLPARSEPELRHYLFAYRIRISNEGARPATLLCRHWIITNGCGEVEEVRGDGVVGEQPRLGPGEQFEYTSACPLNTQSGEMRGAYTMVDDDGQLFTVEISPFRLYVPPLCN